MAGTSPFYRSFARSAVAAVPLLLRDPRQRAAHRARLAAPGAMEEWARRHRDLTRPLAWFHASSVGEGLQARAVMTALATIRPDFQMAYTHFSPSAERFAASVPAAFHGYLGYDRPRDVIRSLAALQPSLLVFAKLDLWPELATRAHDSGAAVALVAATVHADSSRLRWLPRNLTAAGYQVLDAVAAISDDDGKRLRRLGCRAKRISVTGDPRIDSARAVISGYADAAPLLPGNADRRLIAGSTWPEDEQVLLSAFAHLRPTHPDARLVIVPHQPTAEHLAALDTLSDSLGLAPVARLSALAGQDDPAVLVVDRTGILAGLYREGFATYVGGGFGSRGIHSVIEPAAAERGVIIGPHDRASRDAKLLERGGGLVRLPEVGAADALTATWTQWLDAPTEAAEMGKSALAALGPDVGAAMRTAEVVAGLAAPS